MTDVPKGKVPIKVGPGDIRYVDAKVGPDGQVKILPPRRPKIIVKPSVNTTIPNPRILASVAPVARNLVLRTAKVRDPEPYAFGISLVRPLVIAADDSGEYLVLDLLWSVGEVEGVCNGVGSYTHSLNIGDLGIKNVSDTSLHEHFVGTAGQSASTIMTALKGSYDALPGKAHSVISLQQGWNLNLWGATSGVHVADPRTSPHTVAFTENPALILADIFDRCGYPINWASVADAANYCDEIVAETTSPGEKRWTVGGVIQDRNSLQYWVHALAQYANCYVDIRGSSSGGEVILIPDKPRSSNHTVTAASIVEGSERLTYRGSRDAPEQVIVNYGNNGYNFSVDYGTSGGPGTETTLQMPFWDDGRNAGRKARETYNKANNAIESLEFVGWDDGLIRTLGDVGTVTLSSVGLSSQLMALVENEPVQRGRWRRRYIEYNAANYIDEFGGTVSTSGSDTINNPYNPPNGPTPTLTAELVTTASPNYYRIKIEFSPVTWAYLQDYKINVYQDGVSPQPVLHSEYVAKGSETGSPLTITVYADLNDSPGFQMNIGTSPQTVYRVDIYNRSLWTDQEGGEILSSTPGTATVTDPAYQTTAKHFGAGDSPFGYYRTGGGSVIGDSPQNWNALLPAPFGSGDTYEQMTLVFCVHPNEHRQAWIFGSKNAQFGVAMNDTDGGFWLTARDASTNLVQNVQIPASASPTNGVLAKDQWHAVMISALYYTSPSSGIYVEIYIDGVEVYSGDWNTTGDQFNPMSYSGYVYAGAGDYVAGTAPGHDPDLWEGLDCYVSHVWCKQEHLDPYTYWSSFFDASNKPIDLGADGSTPTGSAPESFFPDGDFTNNRGTGANWDSIGTVPAAPSSPTD